MFLRKISVAGDNMNIHSILNLLGSLLLLVALSMIIPIVVGIYYQEPQALVFVVTAGFTFISGKLLKKFKY
jgi:uncharacterized membrane protein (DUF373 family)